MAHAANIAPKATACHMSSDAAQAHATPTAMSASDPLKHQSAALHNCVLSCSINSLAHTTPQLSQPAKYQVVVPTHIGISAQPRQAFIRQIDRPPQAVI